MSLAEELHRVLEHFRLTHVPTLTNQGAAVAVEHHLAHLSAVAGDVQRGNETAMRVLGELYGAPETVPAAEPGTQTASVPPETVPAVAAEPEHVEPTPAEPVPADIVEAAHAAVEEASAPVEPQGTEAA